jgi:hypothetical protein
LKELPDPGASAGSALVAEALETGVVGRDAMDSFDLLANILPTFWIAELVTLPEYVAHYASRRQWANDFRTRLQ